MAIDRIDHFWENEMNKQSDVWQIDCHDIWLNRKKQKVLEEMPLMKIAKMFASILILNENQFRWLWLCS